MKKIARLSVGFLVVAMLCVTGSAVPAHAVTTANQSTILSIGATGTEVLFFQQVLYKLGYLTVAPSGYYGSMTKKAVASLQSTNALAVTGTIDEHTRYLLNTTAASLGITAATLPVTTETAINTSNVAPIKDVSLTFTATPLTVTVGSATKLAWTSSNAKKCTASGEWTGSLPLSGTKTITYTTTGTRSYTLTCNTLTSTASNTKVITVVAKDAPTVTPPPTPVPNPVPTPTPVPATTANVVSEGDSISVFWSGNHTGIYSSTNPSYSFKGLAVGGSGITTLVSRQQAVLDSKPKVFTVLVGANDLMNYSSASAFTTALFNYVATIKATGAKVAVATILPQANATSFNARRAEANALIRSAVGTKIDAVIDFAADPVMGPDAAASNTTLYKDGVHPTDGSVGGVGGQGKLAVIYTSVVNALLTGTPAPAPTPASAPTLVFAATPTTVTSGGNSVLTWTSSNATACTASGIGFSGSQMLSGQETVSNITSNQTFTLYCTGTGGSVSKSVTVTVASAPAPTPAPAPAPGPTPAPTLTFTASATSLSAGGSVDLSWATTNATSCTGTGAGLSGAQPTASKITLSNVQTTQSVTLSCSGTGGTVSKTLTITVTAAPPPSPNASVELPLIPSNFDINSELVPSWGTGAIPVSAAPDVVGAFRFICNASHEAFDDPIVFPGQPGKSHLHEFFGNTLTNANSTYSTLRTSGNSTCNSPLNRSAYWVPAMINGANQVVRPDYVAVYYKRRPDTDPLCQKIGTACVNLPRGLRFVFGANLISTSPDTGGGYFNCTGPTATPGHYKDIATAAANCPVGNQIGAVISAPECWDGKNLDSADHRSHVAYSQYIGQSYAQCPPTHPYVIPTFTLGIWYTVDSTLDRSGTWNPNVSTWHFSSDGMPTATKNPGSTFHSDWFGAWDDTVKGMWEQNCVNKLLNCSGGDLGNGKQLKMYSGFSWTANPRTVPIPSGGPMAYIPKQDYKLGSTGKHITALQNVLKSLGFLNEKATGYFGSLTQKALSSYQSSLAGAAGAEMNHNH